MIQDEMNGAPIKKSSESWRVKPHLLDYEKACASFTWDTIRRELGGLPGGLGLNIAHEAVDRHANGPRRDQPAIRWLGRDGTVLDLTYADLKVQTNRFANVLSMLGVDKGDRVLTLTGKIPELYIAAIGAWKQVAVFCPLFSAFGPEPIYQRLRRGDAKVLVTTKRLYRQKVAELRERLPQLTQIDYDREVALVLCEPPIQKKPQQKEPELLGVVRFAADPDNERAEFAILLRGDMTGMGLGPMLMRCIIDYAKNRGVGELFGEVLTENRSMLRLCEAFGFTKKRDPDEPGVLVVSLAL